MTDRSHSLPDGWSWVRLSDVIAEAKAGFACGARDPKGVVQLRMNNVDTRGNMAWEEFIRVPAEESVVNEYELRPGDVLFNNTNSVELVGKSALFLGFREPVVYSNHFTRLRVLAEQLDPQYFAAWLLQQWQLKAFESICNRWIGQSAVKNDKLLALEIPLPPVEEQKRIAAILNERMGAVERARAAAEAQLEAAKALLAAYLRAVFDGPAAQEWPSQRIEDISETCSGSTPPRGRVDFYGGNIAWVKTGELTDGVIEDTEEHITKMALRDCSLRLLPVGTLLVAMYGQGQTRGRTAMLARPATTNQACFAVLPNPEKFDPKYVQYWFRHNYERLRRETEGRGGNQPNLNGIYLRKQAIPLPPICDQECVVAALDGQMAWAERVRKAIEEELDTINKLPTALLRRAFSGAL
jgi:type I restriction enzyme S subunit